MKPIEPILTVSAPPHVHCGRTTRSIQRDWLLAMLPAAVMAVVTFGLPALRVMALSCGVAVLTEVLCWIAMRKEPEISDFSPVVIGLLFAFLLPASAPWWLVIGGSVFSVLFGKMVFGGIGASPLCAPIVGWALASVSWPSYMDTYATMLTSQLPAPLHQFKYFGLDAVASLAPMNLALGQQLGGLGAVQIIPLLLGAAYLLFRRVIRWEIPVFFLIGLLATACIYWMIDPKMYAVPQFHLLAGSAIFGAFFLATDYSSSPNGLIPNLFYGLTAGAMVIIIRVYGIYPDGTCYAILLANLFVPLFDRLGPKPFGAGFAAQGGRS